MPNLLDTALNDFPKSEIWRLQTDGWQATAGPLGFTEAFVRGMDAGFDFLRKYDTEIITTMLIEDIYNSAYQYEAEYITVSELRKGYCTFTSGFELLLPYEGIEHFANVSLSGLDELVFRLGEITQAQGDREYPQFGIEFRNREKGYSRRLSPGDFSSLDEFKAALEMHLRKASGSKDKCLGPKTAEEDLTIVNLVSYPATRDEILNFVRQDIETYYAELNPAKQIVDPQYRKAGEINAINHFIRSLHQSHYFPDGNGRTFIFLLANMLHLQNGHGLKITFDPAHYAAYSRNELLSETIADLAHFQSWKITEAKEYLATLSADSIINHCESIRSDLISHLNPDPLIAMAQINELYVQIGTSKLSVPTGYKPGKKTPIMQTLFSSKHPYSDKIAHTNILNLLKIMYQETLEQLVKDDPKKMESTRIGYGSKKQNPEEVLASIVARHNIALQCNSAAIGRTIAQIAEVISSPAASSSSAS